MKIYLKILAVIIICVISYMLQVTTVRAQQLSLSISPPLLEVLIKPGKSILVAYTINNLGDPTILKANVRPFEPLGNNGAIKIMPNLTGPVRFSLDNSQLTLNKEFFMNSKKSEQLLLRIRVPDGAPEGDYYYTVFVETSPPPTREGETASRASATLGSNILITVSNTGQTELKGKIVQFDLLSRFGLSKALNFHIFDSSDPIPLVLIAQNAGKNLIKPNGTVTLRGNFGEKAEYTILPQNILSQSQRLLTATPSASLDCEQKQLEKLCSRPVSLILKGFFLGKYSLSTQISFAEGSQIITASTNFIALPLKFIAAIIISIPIIIILIKKLRKNKDI